MIALYNNLPDFPVSMSKPEVESALRQTVLGKEHPFTLAGMNNLASVLDSQDS